MSVSLTPAAARHVQKSLTKRGRGIGLRLAVKTSGCNGFAYALEFVDTLNPDDECFETNGTKIIVDARSLGMLAGTG
jgi:iron-sulfur cluster assembly protein